MASLRRREPRRATSLLRPRRLLGRRGLFGRRGLIPRAVAGSPVRSAYRTAGLPIRAPWWKLSLRRMFGVWAGRRAADTADDVERARDVADLGTERPLVPRRASLIRGHASTDAAYPGMDAAHPGMDAPYPGMNAAHAAARWRDAVARVPLEKPRPFPARLRPLVARLTGSPSRSAYTAGPATRHALDAAGARGASTGTVVHLPAPPDPGGAGSMEVLAHELAHTRNPVSRPRFLLRSAPSSHDPDERAATSIGRAAATNRTAVSRLVHQSAPALLVRSASSSPIGPVSAGSSERSGRSGVLDVTSRASSVLHDTSRTPAPKSIMRAVPPAADTARRTGLIQRFGLPSGITSVTQGAASSASGLADAAGSPVSGLTDIVGSQASGFAGAAGSPVSGLADAAGSQVSGLAGRVSGLAGGALGQAGQAAAGVVDELPVGSAGASGMSGVLEAATQAARSAVSDALAGVTGAAGGLAEQAGGVADTAGEQVTAAQGAADGRVQDASEGVSEAAGQALEAGEGAIGQAAGALGNLGGLAAGPELDRIAEAIEQRLLRQLERRGGRYAGVF